MTTRQGVSLRGPSGTKMGVPDTPVTRAVGAVSPDFRLGGGAAWRFQPMPPDDTFVQLLTPEGERVENPDFPLDITDDELRGLYRDLVLVRRIDAEATALQRQGELGLWAQLLGQEAAQVGAGRALTAGDMAFPTYREHGVAWCRDVDPLTLLGPLPGNHERWLEPGGPRLRALHDRHRRPVPAGRWLRHGVAARWGRERDDGLLRRRRQQPR